MKMLRGAKWTTVVAVLLGAAPNGVSQIAADQNPGDGLLLRIGGDVAVEAGANYGAVIVLDGDAVVSGNTEFLLVVGGEARLSGASVGHVVVADGELALTDGAQVTGDVELFRSTLSREAGVTVSGQIREKPMQHSFRGAWFFGVFLALGVAAAIVGAGLIATAFARDGVRQVGNSMLTHLTKTLIGTAVLWLGLPLVAVMLMPTIIAVPASIGVFLFVLPVLGFVGFVLAGIALGRAVMHSLRPLAGKESPYLASALGITLLLMAGLLPIIGAFVAPLAGAVGSGALAVTLWQRAKDLNARGPAAAPA